MTFRELINEYLTYCQSIRQQKGWIKQKRQRLNHIERRLPKTLTDIGSKDVHAYLRSRKDSSPRTVNLDISLLRSVFSYAEEEGYIGKSPVARVKNLPVSKQNGEAYTMETLDKMTEMATPKDKAYLLVLKNTLGRVGEINKLRWKDVDLDRGVISLGFEGSRTKPRRQLPMNKKLHKVLSDLKKKGDGRGYIFGFTDKRKMLKNLSEKAGTTYKGFHALRRGVASFMLKKGISLRHIQLALGHTNLQATQRYLCVTDDELRGVLDLL